MKRRSFKTFRLLLASLILILSTQAATAQSRTLPRISFLNSAPADFLYFLFNRTEPSVAPKLDSLLNMGQVPTIDALISLPEIVASEGVTTYEGIYPVLERYYSPKALSRSRRSPKKLAFSDRYPSYDTLLALVRAGAPYYPKFLEYWKEHVAPAEYRQMEVWRQQLTELQVLDSFYALTRMRLRTDSLQIAAIAFHVAGSANYTPAGIYTSLFKKPNLPWVIGHEATHLLLTGPVGVNWMKRPAARALAALAKQKGENLYEIEENMCHFMQALLSRTCGTRPKDYAIAAPYPEGFRKRFLEQLEAGLHQYRAGREDLADWMMRTASITLLAMPDAVRSPETD
ncbi:MAG: hypothetical protein EOO16_18235 [Chitinophagaceae bacterium]|nr:MAG: hypothetical protein EOO16_18235 [Chitinophagaceae bacterium]